MPSDPTPPQRPRTQRPWRAWIYQALMLLAVLALVGWLVGNTGRNMAQRGIQSGFDFLLQPAGFEIGESLFDFDASQAYWLAFLTGLGNTVRVALVGCVLATLLGTALGLGRRARHPLLSSLCACYVELFRNIPLLLQLLMSYLLLAQALPAFDAPWQMAGLRLDKGGLAWLGVAGTEPVFTLSPEFLALTLGLSLYTAAFIAEIVRAGLQAVPRGQALAAAALGLRPAQALRYVQMPQALRLIVPPLTNQFLNLTKNSSLAVAIGYPDVVSIANTAINQTGRAVECIAVVMAVYLCTSLLTAAVMHRYNARVTARQATA